jgi:hypothetical protein
MFRQGLMVISRWLQAEYHLRKTVFPLQLIDLREKLLKSFSELSKNIPLNNTLPVAAPKKALCFSLAMSRPTTRYSVEPRISFLN